jgi:DNA-binding transcriptional MocR family regulator
LAQRTPSSASKFLLTVIADAASVGDWRAWPSVAYLSEITQQDRKTVLKNLKSLEVAGLIESAGRAGKTGQVTVWRLPVPALISHAKSPKNGTADAIRNGPKTGTDTAAETVPNFPAKNPNFPAQQYQKRDTEPVKNQSRTTRGACAPQLAGFESAGFQLPSWIPAEAWAAWLEMRKAKKKAPTDRAKAMVVKTLDQLRSEGHDPEAVLDQSTRNSWTDVFPLKSRQPAPQAAAAFNQLPADEQLMPE